MILNTLNGGWHGDLWEHSAVVKELGNNPLNSGHLFFLSEKAHHSYSLYPY